MNQFRNYFSIMKMTFKTIPVWSIYTVLNNILGIICNLLGSVILVDIVLTGISLKKKFLDILIPVLIIQLIIMFGAICTSIYYGKIDPIARLKLDKKATSKLINNMMTTEIKNLDNADFLDDFTFAVNQIKDKMTGSVFLISNIISNVVGLLMSIIIIGFVDLEIILLVLVVVIMSFVLNRLLTKFQFDLDNEIILPSRKKSYVERVYYMKKYALEIRMYPISTLLQNIYVGAVKDTVKIIRKYGFKIGILLFIKSYSQEIVLFWGSMGIILFKFFNGDIVIDSVSVIPTTIAIYGMLEYVLTLSDIVKTLKEIDLYAEKFYMFFNKTKCNREKEKIDKDKTHNICFRNVSFQYSTKEKFLLKNINLKFSAGEKIALVGVNGSGKSTIIKLLLGLYEDYSGEITIDNEPISNFDIQSYREQFSVVQQEFQQYPCSIAENILMDSAIPKDINKIKRALEAVDLKLNLSDNELMTKTVTSEFYPDGLILSKGQYQKLAIARVFASDKNFIVLDEPTSALDPISEYTMFNNLIEHFKERTIVIISHRLTATKNADKIYLIDNGVIAECGNHQQLMELGGKYAQMYSLQAEKYL